MHNIVNFIYDTESKKIVKVFKDSNDITYSNWTKVLNKHPQYIQCWDYDNDNLEGIESALTREYMVVNGKNFLYCNNFDKACKLLDRRYKHHKVYEKVYFLDLFLAGKSPQVVRDMT